MDNKELMILDYESKIAELRLQLHSLENLLISKGLLSVEELQIERKSSLKSFIKEILTKANVAGDLDKLSEDLSTL